MANGTSCEPFPNDPNRCTVILAIRHSMAAISMASSVFCLFVIWALRKYEHFSQRLILWLTVAAFFDSIAYVLGDLQGSATPYCTFQAFMLQYFDWASLLWVCCISFNLYWNVIRQRTSNHFEYIYHGICWLFPLLMASIPFAKTNGYRPAGLWCWISSDYVTMRFLLWYIPVWIAAIGLLATYIYIIYKLKKQVAAYQGTYNPETERNKELLKEDISGLKYYPLVYLVISLFPTINRVQNALNGERYMYGLLVLHTLFSPLQGFLNAIVFTFDKDTKSRLTVHQLWASIRSRFSKTHSVKPYEPEDSLRSGLLPAGNENTPLHSDFTPSSADEASPGRP